MNFSEGKMFKVERYVYRSFHIDANRINSRSKLPAMNQLEKWRENGVIDLEWSNIARKEAIADGDRLRNKKALDYIYTETLATTPKEQEQLRKITSILFPNKRINSNQRNDVEIVFNALKYLAILITNDGASKSQPGGILGHKKELKEKLCITVMSDEEAIEYIRKLISIRDQRARDINELHGEPLPNWVGKD